VDINLQWIVTMKPDKEYYRKYYKDHKEKIIKKSIEWQKNNPEKARKIRKRYREKEPGERKKPINKTNYGETPLKKLYIKLYGKDLENKMDNISHVKGKKRIFCVDCPIHNKKECPGWENCNYKGELLKIINKRSKL